MNIQTLSEKKVHCLGPDGSYSSTALKKSGYDADSEIILAKSNPEVISQMLATESACIIPIGNKYGKRVASVLEAIHEARDVIQVVGWIRLKIDHVIAAHADQKIKDLTNVYSHPQAILQCKKTLERYPNITPVHATSTTSMMGNLNKWEWLICSEDAAISGGLKVLIKNAAPEDNETLFALLKHKNYTLPQEITDEYSRNGTRIAVIEGLDEEKSGSLYESLGVLKKLWISMSYILSQPDGHGGEDIVLILHNTKDDEILKQEIEKIGNTIQIL